jgi:hypothetical protein
VSKILELLEAVWASKKVAIMHCPGHQKGKTPVALGNWREDQEARAAVSGPPPLIKDIKGDLKEIGNLTLLQQMHGLGKVLNDLHHHVRDSLLA